MPLDVTRKYSMTNCNCNNAKNCQAAMADLRALDFAIQETVLYLDAYPECGEALEYYHALLEQRKAVSDAYEKSCGPLTAWGNRSRTSWDWVKAPWPWELDANR